MKQAAERLPELTEFGFGVFDEGKYRKFPDLRQSVFDRERADLLSPSSIARFAASVKWLEQWSKTKKFSRRGTSYGLKHVAENDIGYVTNGVFIAAAVTAGFTTKREGPNAVLNISDRAWTGQLVLPRRTLKDPLPLPTGRCSSDVAITTLNARFAACLYSPQPDRGVFAILEEVQLPKPHIRLCSWRMFSKTLSGSIVDGIGAARWWLGHPDRRSVERTLSLREIAEAKTISSLS